MRRGVRELPPGTDLRDTSLNYLCREVVPGCVARENRRQRLLTVTQGNAHPRPRGPPG